MKKLLRVSLLMAALTAVLCISALAAEEPAVAGLYNISGTNVTVTPKLAAGGSIEASAPATGYSGFYQDAAKFDVTYTNADIAAGEQYLLLVCSGTEGAPSESNIVYINQTAAAADDSVTFENAYPSALGKGSYRVYVVGAHSAFSLANPTATFDYFVPYTPGNVVTGGDEDAININDAMAVIYHIVGKESLTGSALLAANVVTGGDEDAININDAMQIIYFIVGKITSF